MRLISIESATHFFFPSKIKFDFDQVNNNNKALRIDQVSDFDGEKKKKKKKKRFSKFRNRSCTKVRYCPRYSLSSLSISPPRVFVCSSASASASLYKSHVYSCLRLRLHPHLQR